MPDMPDDALILEWNLLEQHVHLLEVLPRILISSLHLDFEAKSYTDVSVNISKKNELQGKPNISCGATPKGKNLQNLLHQGRIFYGLRFVRKGEDQ